MQLEKQCQQNANPNLNTRCMAVEGSGLGSMYDPDKSLLAEPHLDG